MILSIASGKGGTGKTTVAVNLALSLKNVQLLDCDVEEPNAHLFLRPEIEFKRLAAVPVPEVIEERCTLCGKCQEVCAYNCLAVLPGNRGGRGTVLVFPNMCHGCGACSMLCPEKAIREIPRPIGVVEGGRARHGAFVQGRLNVGEAMAPPLIRHVKRSIDREKTVIIDAPPGTSCPMIESVKGSDFCLLVTEPTPFGLNDLILAVEALKVLGVPCGIVLNRCDIGDPGVENYACESGIPILMRIPFDRDIAMLYSNGVPLIDGKPEFVERFRKLAREVESRL